MSTRFVKFQSNTKLWKDDNVETIDAYVDSNQIVAFKGLGSQDDAGNKTLLYIAHNSADGWIEMGVSQTTDEVAKIVGAVATP